MASTTSFLDFTFHLLQLSTPPFITAQNMSSNTQSTQQTQKNPQFTIPQIQTMHHQNQMSLAPNTRNHRAKAKIAISDPVKTRPAFHFPRSTQLGIPCITIEEGRRHQEHSALPPHLPHGRSTVWDTMEQTHGEPASVVP